MSINRQASTTNHQAIRTRESEDRTRNDSSTAMEDTSIMTQEVDKPTAIAKTLTNSTDLLEVANLKDEEESQGTEGQEEAEDLSFMNDLVII